ncbi:hypothetical protein BC834DRAFT_857983 [Gloeopeniophorella convolvens]|nr:hypothetical protein BC834DRAFT_857983 [Gloeopeniophorella convolvens]
MELESHDHGRDETPAFYDGSLAGPLQASAYSNVVIPQADTLNAPLERPYSQDLGAATQWGAAAVTFPPGVHGQPYHILPGTNDRHVPGGMHDQPHPAIPSVTNMAGNLYPGNTTRGHPEPAIGHYDTHPASNVDYGAHWYPPGAGPVPIPHNAASHGPPQDPAAYGWAHRGAAWDTQPPPPVIQMPPGNQEGSGGLAGPSARIVWIQQNGNGSALVLFEISQVL